MSASSGSKKCHVMKQFVGTKRVYRIATEQLQQCRGSAYNAFNRVIQPYQESTGRGRCSEDLHTATHLHHRASLQETSTYRNACCCMSFARDLWTFGAARRRGIPYNFVTPEIRLLADLIVVQLTSVSSSSPSLRTNLLYVARRRLCMSVTTCVDACACRELKTES